MPDINKDSGDKRQPATVAESIETLPQYDGFPYLNTRVCSALYHITLLPEGASESTLVNLARAQVAANRLDVCLVLAPSRCIFFWADGRIQPTTNTPRGGTLLANILSRLSISSRPKTCGRVKRTSFASSSTAGVGTYLTGDLTKGGRRATPEELERLGGTNGQRVPRGLTRCATCGEWRGECLDPNPQFAGMVMRGGVNEFGLSPPLSPRLHECAIDLLCLPSSRRRPDVRLRSRRGSSPGGGSSVRAPRRAVVADALPDVRRHQGIDSKLKTKE